MKQKDLRDFGLVTGALFIALFGLLFPILRHHAVPRWPWVLGICLVGAGLIAPRTLTYPYKMWSALGLVLGWINIRIVLTAVYSLAIIPTGLILRLLGRDPMKRKFDSTVDTYRVMSRPVPKENLDRTY